MPADWLRPLDVERHSDAGDVWEFELPLAQMPRLAPELAVPAGRSVDGTATCRVAMSRERGQPVATVQVSARVPLRCQRCLRPVSWPVEADSQVWLVTDPAQADELDPGIEPTLAPGGRVVLRDLVEEEILLSVPLVPRHDDVADCGPGDVTLGADAPKVAKDDTITPFAGLGELLKRGR
jgi:uncharacterized protein